MSTQLAVEPDQITDQEVERYIALQLENRPLKVAADSEVKRHLSLDGVSNTRMMRRLGSMIERGIIVRERRKPEYLHDSDRPVTYSLHPDYVFA